MQDHTSGHHPCVIDDYNIAWPHKFDEVRNMTMHWFAIGISYINIDEQPRSITWLYWVLRNEVLRQVIINIR
jgi:hypothetical protein